MKVVRKPEYAEKLHTTSFRKCHTLRPKIQVPTETRICTTVLVTGTI